MSADQNGVKLEDRVANAVDALAQEEAAKAGRSETHRPRRVFGGVVLLAVSVVALAASMAWGWNKWQRPAGTIADAVIVEGAKFELEMVARAVDAYRRNTGQFPASLGEVAQDSAHVRLRVTGDSYELETDSPGGPVRLSRSASR
jgi:hypothetical protein